MRREPRWLRVTCPLCRSGPGWACATSDGKSALDGPHSERRLVASALRAPKNAGSGSAAQPDASEK